MPTEPKDPASQFTCRVCGGKIVAGIGIHSASQADNHIYEGATHVGAITPSDCRKCEDCGHSFTEIRGEQDPAPTSGTPRTDAEQLEGIDKNDDQRPVTAKFARQLERDLATATAQLDAVTKERDAYMIQPPPGARQHIVQSAGYWFNMSRSAQSEGRMGYAVLGMENAYNHVENALAASRAELAAAQSEAQRLREGVAGLKAERDEVARKHDLDKGRIYRLQQEFAEYRERFEQ